MTLKDDILRDIDTVFLNTDEFAETVTRYPGGDLAAGVPVVAVWIPQDARRDDEAGRNVVRGGTLNLPVDSPVGPRDSWKISGEVWFVKDHPGVVDAGMRQLELTRDNRQTRTGGAGRLE